MHCVFGLHLEKGERIYNYDKTNKHSPFHLNIVLLASKANKTDSKMIEKMSTKLFTIYNKNISN